MNFPYQAQAPYQQSNVPPSYPPTGTVPHSNFNEIPQQQYQHHPASTTLGQPISHQMPPQSALHHGFDRNSAAYTYQQGVPLPPQLQPQVQQQFQHVGPPPPMPMSSQIIPPQEPMVQSQQRPFQHPGPLPPLPMPMNSQVITHEPMAHSQFQQQPQQWLSSAQSQPMIPPPIPTQQGFAAQNSFPGQQFSPAPPSNLPPGIQSMPPTQYPQNMTSPMLDANPIYNQMPPQPYPQQSRAKLDPDAMPSIVQVCEDDRNCKSCIFQTGFPTAEMPPLTTTKFIVQDQGNSNPKFIRSTIYAVPQSSDINKTSNIPLSLAITPMARLNPNEYAPPIINPGEMGPVRCQRCKAYMCPFMEFIDGGRKFRCPFCRASSHVEDTYFAHLDHSGRRTDYQNRPELFLGSYEYIATDKYCKNGKKPKEPAFIFMLDVSYNAMRSGLVELFSKNIVNILKELPREYGAENSSLKIGLATFDQTIHFYNLSQPNYSQMHIVNDIHDVFIPFVEGFLVDFTQSEKTLVSCLNEIVNSFSNTRITETILGPVIQAGLDALKNSDRTGKVFLFSTSLPSLEAPGQLKNREDRKLLGTEKERSVLSPASDFYTKLGEQCVQIGCTIDFFFFPNSYIDIASIAPLASTSGGSVYKYQYFDAERDGPRFLSDLQTDVSREIVFDVMLRLRASTGLRPTGYFGNFFMQNTTDIELGALDCDKSVQIEIKYDDKLDEKEFAYFQVAILFTSCGGQRRLRIHNISLPVTSDYGNIYRLIDEECLTTHLFKQAEQLVREQSPKDMRDEITQRVANILAVYRDKCSRQTPTGQLILPECAKLLPLHTNCILKSDALTGGNELTVDDRAWMMQLVPSMTVEETMGFLYPKVYALSQWKIYVNENNSFSMPPQIRASFEYFSTNEVYLIESGLVSFIWVGLNTPKQWLQDVFNVSSPSHLDTEKTGLLDERDTEISRALCDLYQKINYNRSRHLKLYIIKEQDGLESWMKKFLSEDRYGTASNSYVEFLCHLHHEIRNILS